jgi:hypothetical protein
MPTRQFEILFAVRRNSRRTIVDAIEVLREAAEFKEHNRAEIRVGGLRLPSGQVVGLVNVVFDAPLRDKGCVVPLTCSTQFEALRPGSSQRNVLEVDQLDGASVDFEGNVLLSNGSALRAVEVIPARLSIEPSERDWKIVHHTLSIIGAEQCYRPWPDSERSVLDCSLLAGLTLPQLKQIAWRLEERDPSLKGLSQQKIADALRNFGIRLPAPRPRRKPRHPNATI